MKLTLDKKTLMMCLENVNKALNSNAHLHSLQGILLQASESNVQFLASNGTLSIKQIINVDAQNEVITPGRTLIPGRLFKDIIKKQSTLITIDAQNGSVIITSNGTKTSLNTLNINDYPTISFDAYGDDLVVDAKEFRSVIKNTAFAASDNDRRLILNGVNLNASNGQLRVSATNSFRLAKEVLQINSSIEFDITILSRNLRDFIPANAEGNIGINVNESKIITKHQQIAIVSSLIDGIYPEVTKLIPTSYASSLTINSKDLLDLIEKAIVVSDEVNKVIRLSISKTELTLESKRSEIGDSIVRFEKFDWSYDPFQISFNAQFLIDAISRFSGEVKLSFVDPQKPFVVEGESNANMLQMILPHRSY